MSFFALKHAISLDFVIPVKTGIQLFLKDSHNDHGSPIKTCWKEKFGVIYLSQRITTEFLLYKAPNGDIKVDVLLKNENIWMPQKKIAELFDVNVPVISKHLKNIFDDGELQKLLKFFLPQFKINSFLQQQNRQHVK